MTTLQTIEVTGSHISRAEVETDNPVIVLGSSQIQQTGSLTLGDLVARLPQITGLVTNSTTGGGTTLVGLRGLGSSRTLILIDGQRVVNKDLNSIPIAAVERVEVLPSGASAIYGSDAIGGVINFITKSNYSGAQVMLNYGISNHDDGQRSGENFMFGQASDKGSILVDVAHAKFGAIDAQSRAFAAHTLFLNPQGDGFTAGGTNFAPRGFIVVSPTLSTEFGCPSGGALGLNQDVFASGESPTRPGDYHCWGTEPGDLYDFQANGNRVVNPSESTNVMFKGTYHVTPNIELFATYYHYQDKQSIQVWPSVFGTRSVGGQTISADSYYNPFGVDFSDPDGAALSTLLFNIGTLRYFNSTNTTDQLISGVKGHLSVFNHRWDWDVGFNFGHLLSNVHLIGWPNQPFLLQGLGPSFLNTAGVVQCGTAADPISLSTCVPWDPFNMNSPSALATVAKANAPVANSTWQIERTYHADVTGGVLDLPAGTAQLAMGISYREEYSNNFIGALQTNPPPPSTQLCGLGSQCSAHLNGGFNVKEAYAELFIPILQDLAFAHGLNVTLADRYSKYSDFGSTNNWKVGVEYRPVTDLLLRGTVSQVFRAPTISDLFTAPQSTATFLAKDPCDGIKTPGNPACVGVPTDGSFQSLYDGNALQLRAQTEGAEAAGFPIQPERGKSFDFGFVYSPHQIPGLSVSLDQWRIYLNDNITQISAQTVVNECYSGNLLFCKFIQRTQGGPGAGQLTLVILPDGNLGRLDVKGTDLSLVYKLPATRLGRFQVSVNGTYLDQYKVQTAPGQVSNTAVNLAGTQGNIIAQLFPRVRALGSVGWTLGPWEAEWTLHYIGKFVDQEYMNGDCHESFSCFGSWVYNDVSLGYHVKPIKSLIQVGVDNVFDKEPPLLGTNIGNASNTDADNFDVVGRYYWARLTVNF
ncbi:MAG: TonB-dependent receptor domain-containing protein [Rhodanobacteraceae bacterium]